MRHKPGKANCMDGDARDIGASRTWDQLGRLDSTLLCGSPGDALSGRDRRARRRIDLAVVV